MLKLYKKQKKTKKIPHLKKNINYQIFAKTLKLKQNVCVNLRNVD